MNDTEKFYLKVKDAIAQAQEKLSPKCAADETVSVDIQLKGDGVHISGNIVKKQEVAHAD
jgi:hypothetical protein